MWIEHAAFVAFFGLHQTNSPSRKRFSMLQECAGALPPVGRGTYQ